MGHTVMHGTDVCKTAAGIAYSKAASGLSFEIPEAGIIFTWVCFLFFLTVDIKEDLFSCFGSFLQMIADGYCHIAINL